MVEPYNYAYKEIQWTTGAHFSSSVLIMSEVPWEHHLQCSIEDDHMYPMISQCVSFLEPPFLWYLQPRLHRHVRCGCLYAGWSSESEPDPSETKVSLAIYVSLFYFMNGMGLRMDNSISPCLFGFWRGGVGQAIINNFHFLGYIHWSVPANSNQLQCRMFICIFPWSAWVCPRSESEKWFYPASGKSLPSLSLQTLK